MLFRAAVVVLALTALAGCITVQVESPAPSPTATNIISTPELSNSGEVASSSPSPVEDVPLETAQRNFLDATSRWRSMWYPNLWETAWENADWEELSSLAESRGDALRYLQSDINWYEWPDDTQSAVQRLLDAAADAQPTYVRLGIAETRDEFVDLVVELDEAAFTNAFNELHGALDIANYES